MYPLIFCSRALLANVGCIAEARQAHCSTVASINDMDLLPAQPKPIPSENWEAIYQSLNMKTNDIRNSKSEYQTIFIVYSSKRPQIMYKSVEKQITWQDLGPVLRTLTCVLASVCPTEAGGCKDNCALILWDKNDRTVWLRQVSKNSLTDVTCLCTTQLYQMTDVSNWGKVESSVLRSITRYTGQGASGSIVELFLGGLIWMTNSIQQTINACKGGQK